MSAKFQKVVIIPFEQYEKLMVSAGQPLKNISTTTLRDLLNKKHTTLLQDRPISQLPSIHEDDYKMTGSGSEEDYEEYNKSHTNYTTQPISNITPNSWVNSWETL